MDVRTQIKILEFDVSAVSAGYLGYLYQLAMICKYPMKIAVAQGSYLMPAMVGYHYPAYRSELLPSYLCGYLGN